MTCLLHHTSKVPKRERERERKKERTKRRSRFIAAIAVHRGDSSSSLAKQATESAIVLQRRDAAAGVSLAPTASSCTACTRSLSLRRLCSSVSLTHSSFTDAGWQEPLGPEVTCDWMATGHVNIDDDLPALVREHETPNEREKEQ